MEGPSPLIAWVAEGVVLCGQKMGWREGQGLGATASGIAAPISAASGPKQASDKGGLGVVVRMQLLECWLA